MERTTALLGARAGPAHAQGIALIIGSLIAWGLGHIRNGQLYVYQYIFLVNGAMCVKLYSCSPLQPLTVSGLISVIPTYFLLPSHITTARFLTPENKYLALERIRLNNTGTQNTGTSCLTLTPHS